MSRSDDVLALANAHWRLRGAELGERVRLHGRPRVIGTPGMVIHDRVQLMSTVAKLELVTTVGGRLEIGERTYVNYGTSIGASELVSIGRSCLIGTHCILIDNDFHSLEPERRMERPPSAPIVLEDNVWLGARVIVLRGVTIGAGSVVAAGSVVSRDVPPRTVVAGVPARPLREL